MISSFSDAGYLILRTSPSPSTLFFKNAVLKDQVGDHLFEITHRALQARHFAGCGLTLGVARQSLLAVNVYVVP
jgi:hypothetical protein